MNWDRDLPTWPLSALSHCVGIRPHRWHVQETGRGDTLLLLHGAGASTHSWRDLIPIFGQSHHVLALDLPGQGFTQSGNTLRHGLEATSEDIFHLCQSQNWQPAAIIGHSAGAAIALDLAGRLSAGSVATPGVVGINAALGRFEGMAGWLFPALAKVLALNPLTSVLFSAGRNGTARARRLIEGTGSVLGDEGIAYYARLFSDRDHVNGTLQMMAQWRVDDLLDRLGGVKSRCLFLTGENDKAVKPEISARAADAISWAQLFHFPKLGHLAHEEAPEEVAAHIVNWLRP